MIFIYHSPCYSLWDDLISMERRLLNVLEAAFVERQQRIRSLCASSSDLAGATSAAGHNQFAPTTATTPSTSATPIRICAQHQHFASPLLSVDDSGIDVEKLRLGN